MNMNMQTKEKRDGDGDAANRRGRTYRVHCEVDAPHTLSPSRLSSNGDPMQTLDDRSVCVSERGCPVSLVGMLVGSTSIRHPSKSRVYEGMYERTTATTSADARLRIARACAMEGISRYNMDMRRRRGNLRRMRWRQTADKRARMGGAGG
ncbi:hypothetical protein BDN71DRAFT_461680 [Pleurotus eryngii]|uniref:Uncharacterized protein n=1 Tax=Pleurotus eryngii TaxID=5323 RepID=A0A9P6DA87_PLEER|nr:hypothetical protein BDN71DRAFT_461680 [Pleurotus eryngii]